jgi:Transcriptional regulators
MRKVTIYDVAKALDVSPATVTRALNNLPKVGAEKRELIIKTAAEMGYTPNRAATSLSRKEVRIEVVIYGSIAEFYDKILEGVNAAYETLKDFNLKVNKHVMDKTEFGEEAVCELLTKLRKKEPSAVLIYSVSDTEEIALAVDELIRSGIPVMVVNSDISTIHSHYFVRPDGEMAGRMAAEILDWITVKKNICFFMGDRNTGILRHNNLGFLKEAEERKLNIVGKFYDDGSAEKAINYFIQFVRTDMQEVDGIYINSAVSNAICEEFYKRGLLDHYKIVASDMGKSTVKYISEGLMPATIFQNPYKQGSEGLIRIYEIAAERKEYDKIKLINPIIVCKSNVDYYTRFNTE